MTRPVTVLPGPSADLVDGLARLLAAVERVRPLAPRHRSALPREVARLSALLTGERAGLPRDYLSRPGPLAAYLRWFLPWNVLRQGRLLPGLDLPLPAAPRVLDVGAGPLTFACALWLARPELRTRPLRLVAVDRAGPALRAGERLLRELAGPGLSWRLELVGRSAGGRMGAACDLLVAANLLNELGGARAPLRRGPARDGDAHLLAAWERQLAPDGRLLLVEPGVRPAAARLVRLRAVALERGWHPLAPCTHARNCPLPGRRHGAWCHFAADTAGAPPALAELGRRSGLPKERLGLSFLLLGRAAPPTAPPTLRVVSEPFALDGGGTGRYACGAEGLVVLTGEGPTGSGDLVPAPSTAGARRDPRSGAPLVPLPRAAGAARVRRPRSPRDRRG